MSKWIASVLVLGLFATAAYGDDDVIAQRRALMKANGEALKVVIAIMKGGAYDDAAVQAALKSFANAAAKAPALFPPESKTGGDTAALPAIWDNKADFEARFVKLGQDAAAASTSIKDLDSFKAAMPGVLKNCGGCHELYRAKKS